jgi:hypothetical protein
MTNSNSVAATEFDLQALSAHVMNGSTYMYTSDEAKQDLRLLIATVKVLEQRQAAAAHLIRLAIGHGVSPAALDRLDDALDELDHS